jgi:hypothetical protein
MNGTLETPPDDATVIEIEPVTQANLSDLKVQNADEVSIWIQSLSDLSRPYNLNIPLLPTQALHDTIASAAAISTDSF